MTNEDYADQIEQENWDEGVAELRALETERENELWNAGAEARAEDEARRMGAENEARS